MRLFTVLPILRMPLNFFLHHLFLDVSRKTSIELELMAIARVKTNLKDPRKYRQPHLTFGRSGLETAAGIALNDSHEGF